MSAEKRRVAGELTAWHLCGVVKLISGAALNPSKLNPYRTTKPESAKMARVKAAIQRIAWQVLTDGMRAK